ncbi:MAG: TetR family transcriptional regulator [Actinomycetota bacterium]|nr:TetR family transcriptional regulator [Actinomycetota bacterium]
MSTRQRLVEAANRAFAEQGIHGASLVEVTRQAGQRNRGAVHYHFGGRDQLLAAVLDEHADFLARREGELLAAARSRPDDDVASVVEAIIRPAVELAASGESGRNYLLIVGELVELGPDDRSEVVQKAMARTGGYEVYGVLAERVPPMDDELRVERFALMTTFVIGSVARRARARGRQQLSSERFVANLITMATAMVSAPPVPADD